MRIRKLRAQTVRIRVGRKSSHVVTLEQMPAMLSQWNGPTIEVEALAVPAMGSIALEDLSGFWLFEDGSTIEWG